MNNSICRNCGATLNGDVCDNCGYNSNLSNPFKNIITDLKAKEDVGDHVLAYLININEISKEDFKNLIIEFGYLFLDNNNSYSSLLKVTIPKKLFKPEKIFFVALQKQKFMLLGNGFNDAMFKKTAQDMLVMHKVDLDNINSKDYFMQLS